MPYHITTPKKLGEGVVYYVSADHWSDDYDDRKVFSTKTSANSAKNTTVTFNDHTYTPNHLANATVVTE